jgi:hypothetical protein
MKETEFILSKAIMNHIYDEGKPGEIARECFLFCMEFPQNMAKHINQKRLINQLVSFQIIFSHFTNSWTT